MELLTVAILLLLTSTIGHTKSVQEQLKDRISGVYASKEAEPLIDEDDANEEKYGCVVDRCFPDLKICMNARFGITDHKERQIMEARCVIEFGTCATSCFDDYKISDNV